jgi:hypothetical protein
VDPSDSTQVRADQLAQQIAPRLLNEVAHVLPGEHPSMKIASF